MESALGGTESPDLKSRCGPSLMLGTMGLRFPFVKIQVLDQMVSKTLSDFKNTTKLPHLFSDPIFTARFVFYSENVVQFPWTVQGLCHMLPGGKTLEQKCLR